MQKARETIEINVFLALNLQEVNDTNVAYACIGKLHFSKAK